MTRRAGGDKEMPDEVGVPDSFCNKKQDSCCVCESSGHDPEQSFQGYVLGKRSSREQTDPTDSNINPSRKPTILQFAEEC
jgi:hypothetical protein